MKTNHFKTVQVTATIQKNDLVHIYVSKPHRPVEGGYLAEFWMPRIHDPKTPLDHFSHEGMIARLKKMGITIDRYSIIMRQQR